MQRITDKQLEAVIDRLNTLTGNPLTPYTRDDVTGRHSANIGNYHLNGAYGGVSLHRMMNPGGGITDVFSVGHVPKRQLYELMHAYIQGINAGKELPK